MPRNTREWAHRKLQEAKVNLEWSVYHLKDVSSRYMIEHKEISNRIDDIINIILELHNHIEKVRSSF